MLLSRRGFLYGSLGTVIGGCASVPPSPSSLPPIALNGAGASLPAPLYLRWFREYNMLFPQIQVSYQPIGSVAGVRQFVTNTVDFGASDLGIPPEEISKVTRGVLMIPMTIGSIVLAYNLPGVSKLKLSRKTYTNLFLGRIKRWNDPLLVQDNPDLTLPDQEMFVIRRSDASGTTGILTKHLAAISPEWQSGPGQGTSIQWPDGTIGSRGNEGVTAQITQQPGAIGYIESTYAKQINLATAELENKAGKYVTATTSAVTEAIGSLLLPENLLGFVPDPVGAGAFPIVTYSWLLVYKKYADNSQANALKALLRWCLTDGQKFAEELAYVPLPGSLVAQIQPVLETIGA